MDIDLESRIKAINLESAVEATGRLPDMLIPTGISFDNKAEREIIRKSKFFYKGIREWLRHFVLKESRNPEVLISHWKYYKPHAMLSSSLLNLITGLYPHCPELQNNDFGENAPILLWLLSERYDCEIVLKRSGILGKSQLTGVVELQDVNFQFLEGLNQNTITRKEPNEGQENIANALLDFEEAPEAYLAVLAAELASQDSDFDKDYWQPYERCQKRWIRKIRDCKYLQAGCLLETGELFLTGERKKIPNSVKYPGEGLWEIM